MGDGDVALNRRGDTAGLLVEVDLIGVANQTGDTHLEGVDTCCRANTLVVVYVGCATGGAHDLRVTDNRYR